MRTLAPSIDMSGPEWVGVIFTDDIATFAPASPLTIPNTDHEHVCEVCEGEWDCDAHVGRTGKCRAFVRKPVVRCDGCQQEHEVRVARESRERRITGARRAVATHRARRTA